MAMAVIGGLLTSTVLSLLVIPAVFTYVDDFEHWIRRLVHSQPQAAARAADNPG